LGSSGLLLNNSKSIELKGLSDLEQHRICVKRQDPQYAKMTYEEFGALFPRPDGRPMACSIISDILKEKDRWLALNTSDGTVWKRKKRTEQYPILEGYLREWVDRANQATVHRWGLLKFCYCILVLLLRFCLVGLLRCCYASVI